MSDKTPEGLTIGEIADLMKQGRNVQLSPDGFTTTEMAANMSRHFGHRDPRPCRRCQKEWTPGDWNFYDLCDACFTEFNIQKMNGRYISLGIMKQEEFGRDVSNCFESCDEWMKAYPYVDGAQ